MKPALVIIFCSLIFPIIKGQVVENKWYSESTTSGLTIQNSYPKGGPYLGNTEHHFNYSYLVFYSRIINGSESLMKLKVNFSADSISIPNSPGTFLKIFIPQDTMTLEKESLFSYGITELESLSKATSIERTIGSNEDILFYIVAIFYQTENDIWTHKRGGNRSELILQGQELFLNMPPQINNLSCGIITPYN